MLTQGKMQGQGEASHRKQEREQVFEHQKGGAILLGQGGAVFPQLARFQDLGLLLLRLMVAAVFVTSGWSHLTKAEERSKSIGMSQGFTMFLGAAELAGGLGITFGVLTQPAAAGLILVMLGAIQKKIFVWHTGFWGGKTYGWHYELMLIVMNLVILLFDGGNWVLMK
jgi:putative oxidoreductase